MAANTPVRISVVADGRENVVKLPRAVYDGVLGLSLISKRTADATHGRVQPREQVAISDALGRAHVSKATISLRWYYEDGMQSFPETFYIVDRLPRKDGGEWDAMLRRGIEPSPDHSVATANTYVQSNISDKESQERAQLEKERQKKYEERREKERDDIRRSLAQQRASKPERKR